MPALRLKSIGGFAVIFRQAMIALVLGSFFSSHADAALRRLIEDDELIDGSDLIVIAHLKENRFETVKDQDFPPEYDRKIYFTTLVVSQIVKGSGSLGDLRVGLHDPNYPTVLGGPRAIVPETAGDHPDPSAAIGVAAIMGTIWAVTTDDIRQDHIWFLRSHLPPQNGAAAVAGPPALWAPEGIQPTKLVPYYQAIMKGDAKAVAAFDDQKDDRWSDRVRDTSQTIAAKQALIEHDPSARCDELIKVYTAYSGYNTGKMMALHGIIDCGKLGASRLVPLFVNADTHSPDRIDILQAWGGTDYKEAAPLILSWLREETDWWNKNYKTADRQFATHEGMTGGYNDPRVISYRIIDSSIRVLGSLHFVEAVPVITEVKRDWTPAGPFLSNIDPVKTCDDALTALK